VPITRNSDQYRLPNIARGIMYWDKAFADFKKPEG
jgi:hypothetical protein